MKILFSLLFLLLSGLNNHLVIDINANETTDEIDHWELLKHKIITVESEYNPSVIGDGGKAVGLLQIHPIMVREVNRILGEKTYTYNDRYDPEKSIEMFEIYQSHYNPDKDLELAVRLWNGGPHHRRYKKKVDKYIEKINNVEI